MKIAFVANDEETISAHFGRATAVVVVTVEAGQEIVREIREKEGHGADHVSVIEPGQPRQGLGGHGHRQGQGHHRNHASKFTAMEDCQVLVVRGMGSPAVTHAQNMGLEVYVTQERSINVALDAFLKGSLDHDEQRIHHH